MLPSAAEFHHIGYATKSVEREIETFAKLGYCLEGKPFTDQVQGVSGCFLVGPGPRIELLESLSDSKTLVPWLEAGIKMYHLAFLVDDIHKSTGWARQQRARVTVEPVPAVAFAGRYISFVMFRNGLLVEFIEKAIKEEGSHYVI
jgi:methylmalonyl-CoA/ethylmalonyl-CoA epimerase